MREGYGSCSVCVSVCYQATCSCLIPGLYVDDKVPLGFFFDFQDRHCVDFIENTLFKSSSDIR